MSHALPLRSVFARQDEGVYPPAPNFAARLEREMGEGDSILFVEEHAPAEALVGMFMLTRRDGVFRVGIVADSRAGPFASALAAVQYGWHMLDLLAAVVEMFSRDEDVSA